MDHNIPQLTGDHGVAAAVTAGSLLASPHQVKGHKAFVLVPAGAAIKELTREPEQARPDLLKQTVALSEAPSLIEYVNRFKGKDTTLFANPDSNQVLAVLDYHEATTGGAQPSHAAHRALFTAKHSPEWLVWMKNNGQPMDQETFARFIEANAPNFQKPDSATIYELALNMEATKSSNFKSVKNEQNGNMVFAFTENTEAKFGGESGDNAIPKTITVLLRVYLGGDAMGFDARLRYRLKEGKLMLWYDLQLVEQRKAEVFTAIIGAVEQATAIKVLQGWPA